MNESAFDPDLFRRSFAVATFIGIICRGLVLRVNDKQYPSRPQDFLEQIIISGLSGSLGAVAIPALIDKEFSALTFFAVAIQQFQGIAEQERITLKNIDGVEIISKGPAYVEEVASTYEARSYISLFSSLAASGVYLYVNKTFNTGLIITSLAAAIAGGVVGIIFQKSLKRHSIGDIADVVPATISFEGPNLKVNDVVMANIGLEASRKILLKKGVALELIPKNFGQLGIINDKGQRDAVMHNLFIHMGLDKDGDDKDLVTISRTDLNKESVVLIYIPIKKDIEEMITIIKSTPILETSKGKQSDYSK